MTPRSDAPLPLTDAGEEAPTFAEPWHAQLFAMTVKLCEQGHFTWPEWAETFGGSLRQAALDGGPVDGSDYYDVWLASLEQMLCARGLVEPGELLRLKEAWTRAYLNTPHGRPVRLE